jgi:hypothetical protein
MSLVCFTRRAIRSFWLLVGIVVLGHFSQPALFAKSENSKIVSPLPGSVLSGQAQIFS